MKHLVKMQIVRVKWRTYSGNAPVDFFRSASFNQSRFMKNVCIF